MATTENVYTGSTTTSYDFTFPYIKAADVKVSKNDTLLDLTTDYTQATTSITLTSAPLATDKIRIYRVTDDSGLTATFYPGSAIRSGDLNDNFTQNLYSTQEVVSRYMDAGGGTFTGDVTLGEDVDIIFEGGTDDAYETKLTTIDPTADRVISLPDSSGTLLTTGDINSVGPGMITNGSIQLVHMDVNSIDSAQYVDLSIDRVHLAADIVDGTKIADDAIDSEHITDGSIDLAHMSDNSVDSNQYVDGSIDAVHLAADIVDGTKIADDSINSEHIVDLAIDLVHMSANSVDSAQYVDGSIDRDHLSADVVDGTKLEDDAVDSEHIADGAIDLVHMSANSVDSDQYVDGSIDLAHMSVNSVDSDQYVDGSIDLAHMSPNSVDSDQYVDGSIDLVHMSPNSVDSDQYVDGSIDRVHLSADIIDGTKIEDNAIDSEHITDGSIDLAHMSANSVDSDQYVNGSIDTAHIADNQITSAKLDTNIDIAGDLAVDGTSNLDAVDIDGSTQIDGTVTVGVNDTGYDVKFFGDTASAYCLWDTSADDLILSGAAGLVVPDGQVTLGSTAVTSTAAELNTLDGFTGDKDDLNYAKDLKATGVTATEFDYLDGVTSNIQTQLNAVQANDAELTELATMTSGTASALADLTQTEVEILDGATVSTAELNLLDGVTSTTAELNILDGVTSTTAELNYSDGVTSNIQTQLDTKAPLASPALTGTATAVNLTLSGDLTVNGTTTTINSTTLSVDDKNIELGSVDTPSDTTADGGGITLKGASDKTIIWTNSTDTWDFNQGINVTGAGTFSDDVVAGSDPYAGTSNVGIRLDAGAGFVSTRSAGTNQLWVGQATGSGDITSQINAAGAATFNSTLQGGTTSHTGKAVQAYNNSTSNSTIIAQNEAAGPVWQGWGSGGNTSSITAAGAATFTGTTQVGTIGINTATNGGFEVTANGRLTVQVPDTLATNDLQWRGYYGTDLTSAIYANGDATFDGEIGIGPNFTNAATNASGIWLSDAGRTTFYHSSSESGNYLTCTQADGSGGSSEKASISGAGVAIFSSEVQAGANPYSENVTGVKLQSGGQITARSSSTNATFVSMDATGAVTAGATARINANGSAEFASGDAVISSAGVASFVGDLRVGGTDAYDGVPLEVEVQGSNAGEVGITLINKQTSNSSATCIVRAMGENRRGGDIVFGRENANSWTSSNTYADGFISLNPAQNGAAVERLRVTSDGKVGIGVTNPNQSLTVGDGSEDRLQVITAGAGAGVALWSTNNAYDDYEPLAISGEYLQFNTRDSTFSASEKMRIQANGNVGIGTIAPDSTLHIKSPSGSTTQTFTAPSGQPNKLQFRLNDGTLDAEIKNEDATIRFSIGTTPSERMLIRTDSSGAYPQVGIGTSDPACALMVKSGTYKGNSGGNALELFDLGATGKYWSARGFSEGWGANADHYWEICGITGSAPVEIAIKHLGGSGGGVSISSFTDNNDGTVSIETSGSYNASVYLMEVLQMS